MDINCATAGGKKETDVSNMLSQEGTILANFDEGCCVYYLIFITAVHPTTIAHTRSEPAMSTAVQHSDVPRHRSQSTPGKLIMCILTHAAPAVLSLGSLIFSV